jgi:hypothetical protein
LAGAGCVRAIVVVIAEFVLAVEAGVQFPAGIVTVDLLKSIFPRWVRFAKSGGTVVFLLYSCI